MSTTQAKSVDSAGSKPFSYAQAARGTSNAPSVQSSNPASGAITPAKGQSTLHSLKPDLAGAKWADTVEDEIKDHSSASTAVDAQSTSSMKSPTSHPTVNGTSSPASTDFAGSTSTLARDETASPMPDVNEAAWDTKPQASAATRPQKFSTDRPSSKTKKRNGKKQDRKDKADGESAADKDTWIQPPPVPLTEAPVPQVNIWQVRLQQKTTPAVKPTSASTTAVATESTASREESKAATSRASEVKTKNEPPVSEKERKESDAKKTDEKTSARKESLAKISTPMVDQKSWPTPEIAQEEEHKKKPQEAVEAMPTHAAKGKSAWEKIDFTPSVVFNTPLPNTGARRGGRGGSRGGREGQGRAGVNGEKRGDAAVAGQTVESSRRVARSGSQDRSKREDAPRRQSRQESSNREFSVKSAPAEEDKPKSSEVVDHSTSSSGRSITAGRRAPRRPDVPFSNGEKRREDFSGKENGSADSAKGPDAVANVDASINTNTRDEAPKLDSSLDGVERRSSANADSTSRSQERKVNGTYSSFPSRDRTEHRGRGGHRGARNGAHAYHSGNHAFSNGQLSSPYTAPSYNGTNPRSPTGFGQDPYFGHLQAYRYGGRGYGSRASSIAPENGYARMSNFPANGLQINTGVQAGNMYPGDYYMPATAVPYAQEPASNLAQAVAVQVDYYFSVDNLIKDMFFRKHMDSQGFVFLSFVASFKRLRSMTMDLELIKYVCQQSQDIEHCIGSDGVDRLRAARGWDKWVLPKADRDPTAQNDGPDSITAPPRPHPQIFEMHNPLRHSSLPIPNSAGPVLGGGQGFQSLNGFSAPFHYGANGSTDKSNGSQMQTSPIAPSNEQAAMPPSYNPSVSNGNGVVDEEPDTFTDAEVENLRIVYRNPAANEQTGKSHPMPTRSFSNGSLDGSSLADGIGGLRIATNPAITSSTPVPNDLDNRASPPQSERVGNSWSGPSRMSAARSTSSSGDTGSNFNGVFWTKDKDSPQTNEPPPETTTDFYYAMRERALQQRNYQHCPHDMTVIYNFWSHFLVRNFNTRMYIEFRMVAMDDLTSRGSFIGLNSLLKYYGGALANEAPIRRSVASDYVNLVKSEPQHMDRPAFKQLRNAWRDGALNMKNRKRIKDFIDRDLEAELDT